jgi:membrane carboxypeptidase/penicillin-binding protein
LAVEVRLYAHCERYYPFVLGAQPVRPIDLAAFYATVANEGVRPEPYAIEAIDQNGAAVYRHTAELRTIASADKPAFYQLKTFLQGVVARGTARSIGAWSPYVAGKTGTSDQENDAWFAGFSNDVTVVVWVGYDNAGSRRRTLGPGQTGSRVAIPIFTPVMQAVWDHYAAKTPLRGPSPEAARQLIALPINLQSGDRVDARTANAFREYFRLDRTGKVNDTHNQLASRYDYDPNPDIPGTLSGDRSLFDWFNNRRDYDGTPIRPSQDVNRRPAPFFFPFFGR